MGRKSKVERFIILDTEEKYIELQKYKIANDWLSFLRDYEEQLKNLKFEEVFGKSFLDNEKTYYIKRILKVLGHLNMYELDYDEIVRELKISIKHSAEVLEIPEYVRFGKMETFKEMDKDTGIFNIYEKLEYKLR